MTTFEMVRAEALTVILAARFDSVPADVAALVAGATSDQFLTWVKIAATAGTLDQVFPSHGD